MADERILANVNYYNIVWQTRQSVGIATINADNCYNRIPHLIASLVFQALGVPQQTATWLLLTIHVKFFLRKDFDNSKDYAGSTGGGGNVKVIEWHWMDGW